jgi:hypothetical protein
MNDRLGLLMLEYQKLRDESIQSMQAQQSILQWSIGSFGAILGAALVLATKDPPFALPPYVSFGAFAVILPIFATMCCLAWFGELIRMERIGAFLRGMEREVAQAIRDGSGLSNEVVPLRWETYIAFAKDRGLGVRKQGVGYFGSLGVYTIVFASCLATALCSVWMAAPDSRGVLSPLVVSIVVGAELVAYVSIVLYLVRGLITAGRRIPHLASIDPGATVPAVKYDNEVPMPASRGVSST